MRTRRLLQQQPAVTAAATSFSIPSNRQSGQPQAQALTCIGRQRSTDVRHAAEDASRLMLSLTNYQSTTALRPHHSSMNSCPAGAQPVPTTDSQLAQLVIQPASFSVWKTLDKQLADKSNSAEIVLSLHCRPDKHSAKSVTNKATVKLQESTILGTDIESNLNQTVQET